MEPVLETIDLDVEDSNELLFKVQIEGIDSSPARVRLVCESGDVGYVFTGRSTSQPDIVKFVLPSMKDKLKEGEYVSRVEVMIENRYFAPVQFNINFKKQVKVVAEAIGRSITKQEPKVTVTAVPVKVVQPVSEQVKPVVAQPQQRKQPPPARAGSSMTLKERFAAKKDIDDEDVNPEDLAREFVRSHKRR